MTADGGDRALGAPRFDVVLRGYDRRQVDEYVARLHRVNSRLRADLEMARSQPPPPPPPARDLPPPGYPSAPPAARPRPSPRPRSGPPQPEPDVVDGFTDRMQSILSAAEEEAAEIRRQALASRPGEDLRAQVADLVDQRDTVLSELARMRSLIETMMGSTGRGAVEATVPAPAAPTSPEPADAAAQPLPGTSTPTSTEEGSTAPPSSGAQVEPTAGEMPEAKGAHRLPTGEYRSVADSFGSLRPRSEPDPEPSELFRPRSERGAAASTSSAAADRAGDAASEGEATVKVGAVRPVEAASPPEAAEEPPKELPRRANGAGSRTSASRSR